MILRKISHQLNEWVYLLYNTIVKANKHIMKKIGKESKVIRQVG